jgi:hypothetical protein
VFKNPEGDSAGRIIESCGLKGMREGPVEVNELHANYLVNTGGATARQVRTLIERVQESVQASTGITLEREVITLGFPEETFPERAWAPNDHPIRRSGHDHERAFGEIAAKRAK